LLWIVPAGSPRDCGAAAAMQVIIMNMKKISRLVAA